MDSGLVANFRSDGIMKAIIEAITLPFRAYAGILRAHRVREAELEAAGVCVWCGIEPAANGQNDCA